MVKKDTRIDEYINKSQPFARPILKKLRVLIHNAIPEIEETTKWGMPFFEFKGPVCNMAAFKEHAVFGFWKYKLLNDPKGYLGEIANKGGEAMGNLGRITSLRDLPADNVVIGFLKQAKKLNENGIKLPQKKKVAKTQLIIPEALITALKKNKAADKAFNNFSYSHKKEYVDWIAEAKTELTTMKRIETAVEWISEGKSRNWKYMKKK